MNPSETTRVVLLGASNLTRAFPRVVGLVRARVGAPVRIHAALGRGRSYGTTSSLFLRELPAIGECGLWRALDGEPPRTTFALLTDVGNDILYGASVEAIAGWIERDLDRLAGLGARTVMTRLPLASVKRLPAWRFHLVRGVFFPTHRIGHGAASERVAALDERMVALARARDVTLVAPSADWFGIDPIHIARSRQEQAWSAILGAWGAATAGSATPDLAREDRRRLRRARPERRRVAGRRIEREQPSAELLDGTTVALY